MFLFYVNQLPLINFRTKISSVFSQSLLQLLRGQGHSVRNGISMVCLQDSLANRNEVEINYRKKC